MDFHFKSALLMYLRFAVVGFPRITATIRQWKAIISLSRQRERVGVRVGLEFPSGKANSSNNLVLIMKHSKGLQIRDVSSVTQAESIIRGN